MVVEIVNGYNIFWIVWIMFNFFFEFVDMNYDGVVVVVRRIVLNFFINLIFGKYYIGVFIKIL